MQNEREGFPITALREIKIMKLLNHPNVLHLKEICHEGSSSKQSSGAIYLIFDFMEHDLGGLLNRQVHFKTPEIICISKQMFEGLHYIHKNKILHRDMKVANLLLSDKGVLKIADFGLARGYDAKNSKY
jgi:serine/threonine protein kinase